MPRLAKPITAHSSVSGGLSLADAVSRWLVALEAEN
jgi:hypothetical protein